MMKTAGHASRQVHPFVFLILILPFGIMIGYLSVTVAYQLTHAGVSTDRVAAMIAITLIPSTWKFLWAPVVDTCLRRKTWYLIACIASAVGIAATGALPATAAGMALLTLVAFLSKLACTFLGMSVESLLAYGAPADQKGRASGWFQAGNLGGVGLGGGAGLWIATHFEQPWLAGTVLGSLSLLCCLALFFVDEPEITHRAHGIARNVVNVVKDVWKIVRSRPGYLALLICFLPLSSGAASNLWSSVAGDWHASADAVALTDGLLGGLISALGCLAGGRVCDRMDRKHAYALFGALMALCTIAMAIAPRTQSMYVGFVLLYAFITGLTYAAFSAVVLEAIGLGAAATKYNLFASLSNTPIAYMTLIEGWARVHWDTSTMLYAESAMGIFGLLVFFSVVRLSGGVKSYRDSVALAKTS
jgi:PAT family beta-lactamase induction signal transducer AmpG